MFLVLLKATIYCGLLKTEFLDFLSDFIIHFSQKAITLIAELWNTSCRYLRSLGLVWVRSGLGLGKRKRKLRLHSFPFLRKIFHIWNRHNNEPVRNYHFTYLFMVCHKKIYIYIYLVRKSETKIYCMFIRDMYITPQHSFFNLSVLFKKVCPLIFIP